MASHGWDHQLFPTVSEQVPLKAAAAPEEGRHTGLVPVSSPERWPPTDRLERYADRFVFSLPVMNFETTRFEAPLPIIEMVSVASGCALFLPARTTGKLGSFILQHHPFQCSI